MLDESHVVQPCIPRSEGLPKRSVIEGFLVRVWASCAHILRLYISRIIQLEVWVCCCVFSIINTLVTIGNLVRRLIGVKNDLVVVDSKS